MKTKVNNFNAIGEWLDFSDSDKFYFVQTIQRSREHGRTKVINTHFIDSLDKFHDRAEWLIREADAWKARVYIHLNRRSFEVCAMEMMRQLATDICQKDYKHVRRAYHSVCGRHSAEPRESKTWVVDVDAYSLEEWEALRGFSLFGHVDCPSTARLLTVKSYLEKQGLKILRSLPTLNGFHLITSPFRLDAFKEGFPNVDVHKNNPTILYANTDKKPTTHTCAFHSDFNGNCMVCGSVVNRTGKEAS